MGRITIDGEARVRGEHGAVYTVRALGRSERTAVMVATDFDEARTATAVAFAEMLVRAGVQAVEGVEGVPAKIARSRMAGVRGGLLPVDVSDLIPDHDFEKLFGAVIAGELDEADLGN